MATKLINGWNNQNNQNFCFFNVLNNFKIFPPTSVLWAIFLYIIDIKSHKIDLKDILFTL